MAISIRAVGSWAAATATTQTVTLPTHAAGDMLLVRVVAKGPATLTLNNVLCNTSGWAKVGSNYYGGATASGNGSGSVWNAVFYKVATSAAETNPVLSFSNDGVATAMLPSAAVAISYQKAADETWSTPWSYGGSVAAATSISSNVTNLTVSAGDMVDVFIGTNDNTTLTVPTFSCSGMTFGTVTEAPDAALSSATSNDISADGCYRLATAGTSNSNFIVTATNSVADEGVARATVLRVTAAGSSLSGGAAFGWAPNATLSEDFLTSGGAAFGWAPSGELSWPLPITIDSGGGAFGWSPSATLSEDFITSGGSAFGWTPAATLAETFATSGGATFGWAPNVTLAETFATSGGATFGWSPAATLAEEFIASGDSAFGWAPGGTLDNLDTNLSISDGPVFGWSPAATLAETFDASGSSTFGWSPAATLAETFVTSGSSTFGWAPDATLSESFVTSGGATFGWATGGTAAETFVTSGGAAFGWAPAATAAETFAASGDAAFGWAPAATLDMTVGAYELSGGAAFGWAPDATLAEGFLATGAPAFGWASAGSLSVPVQTQEGGGRSNAAPPPRVINYELDDRLCLELLMPYLL